MNKIIMIGMHPRTRALIPWDSDAEIWTLNESPSKEWFKRWDVLFQIHKRWDWERSNNLSDPNHPLFIKAQSGECLYCKGEGKVHVVATGEEVLCPWCEYGIYRTPNNRCVDEYTPKKIIMQDVNEDVPGCVRLNIEAIKKMQPPDENMLTSTLAHMLAFAIHKAIVENPHADFLPNIEIYGFEAESGTEYAAQRPGILYWIGYGRGLGISIEAPGSKLMTGKHYGYEDIDQGYRSRLELRRQSLQMQLNAAEVEAIASEGALKALTPFKRLKTVNPFWEAAYDEHFRKKNFVSFLRGTLKEIGHSIEILDAYRQDSEEATQADARALIEIPYQLG